MPKPEKIYMPILAQKTLQPTDNIVVDAHRSMNAWGKIKDTPDGLGKEQKFVIQEHGVPYLLPSDYLHQYKREVGLVEILDGKGNLLISTFTLTHAFDDTLHESVTKLLRSVPVNKHGEILQQITQIIGEKMPHIAIVQDHKNKDNNYISLLIDESGSDKFIPTFEITRDGHIPHPDYADKDTFVTHAGGHIMGKSKKGARYIPLLEDPNAQIFATSIGIITPGYLDQNGNPVRVGIFAGASIPRENFDETIAKFFQPALTHQVREFDTKKDKHFDFDSLHRYVQPFLWVSPYASQPK